MSGAAGAGRVRQQRIVFARLSTALCIPQGEDDGYNGKNASMLMHVFWAQSA